MIPSKFKSKFSQLTEAAIERFQQGGFVNGDYVKISKKIKTSDFYKGLAEQSQTYIDELLNSDLHLRISAIKSASYPNAPVDGGLSAANNFHCDIIQEYAPGLYRNPITIPQHLLELVDSADALGRMSAPESQVYQNNVHGPEDIKTSDMDRTLPTKNTKLQFTEKKEAKTLEECYDAVHNTSKQLEEDGTGVIETVLMDVKDFNPDNFKNINKDGPYLIKLQDYSKRPIKTVREFRCDSYTSRVVGDWAM